MASSEPWEQTYLELPMQAWLKLKLQEFVPIKELILNFYTSFPQYAGPELTEEKLEDFGVRNLGMKWWKKYFRKLDEQQMEEKIEKAVKERVQDIALVQEVSKQEPELSSEPEPKIEEAVKEAPPLEEFLPKDEKEKIGDLKHHRLILKEIWENYLKVRDSDRAESSKQKYLEQLSKELVVVRELEQTEKGVQSLLEEVRLAEEGETPEQLRDYIEGYCFQVLCRKAKTLADAVYQLQILEKNAKILSDLLKEHEVEESLKLYLAKLYESE